MLEGRRVLDLAEGILIGIHRYRAEAAFEELVAVAREYDVSVSAVASALVAVATGTADELGAPRNALAVVHLAWGDLFDGLAGSSAFDGEGVGETAV